MKILSRLVPIIAGLVLLGVISPGPAPYQVNLPTSKLLRLPAPGKLGAVNSFPASITLSPDGRYAALVNGGYGTEPSQVHQSISVLDLTTNAIEDFPDRRLGKDAHQSYFLGLAFSSKGNELYASIGSITDPTGEAKGDTGNGIAVYGFHEGKISPLRFIKIPPQKLAPGKRVAKGLSNIPRGEAIPYPAGLVLIHSQNGDELLVANNYADNVVVIDPASGKILKSFDLSSNDLVPSSFPYTVVASRDGRRAWCSLWNASAVAELDVADEKITRWIPLGKPLKPTSAGTHPSALVLSPDEQFLYVALSNADEVAVIETSDTGSIRLLQTKLPDQGLGGTYPNALALSRDGTRLFVADAGINAVAVFDMPAVLHSPVPGPAAYPALGFVPTEWYPSALAVRGDDLLIATAKGQGTGPNGGPSRLTGQTRHDEHPYIATLLAGSVARLEIKRAYDDLASLTREVEESNRLHSDPGKIAFRGGRNPIRHVIYVIKENRTYDQILGDLKVGNGDPSLTVYGEDVTPNEHKLARQFGVLDNFYVSGEVSGDGHVWSTAAITSDYNEKTWQIAYRGEERTYDYQGMVADEYPLDAGESDVDDPGTGFLWGNVATHGLTYRDYGEFINGEWCAPKRASAKQGMSQVRSTSCPRDFVDQGQPLPPNVGQPHGSPSPWPWRVPLVERMVATKPELKDHFDPLYPDFETSYPDQLRADEFLNEFEGFVRAREQRTGTELPQFILLYLPDDHTAGTRPGSPRPAASVADNDLALGRVVDAVSHSPYWEDTAIFVLEDDAQNGADHVDAHRSIAFVISKYSPGSSRLPYIAHDFYTTVNMIHTIEALLRLPPMNQNDAYASVMAPMFSGEGNQPPFNADGSNRDNGLIYQVNPPRAPGAEESKRMDFTRPDAANASALNQILWRDRKGNTPIPASPHGVVGARRSYRE